MCDNNINFIRGKRNRLGSYIYKTDEGKYCGIGWICNKCEKNYNTSNMFERERIKIMKNIGV